MHPQGLMIFATICKPAPARGTILAIDIGLNGAVIPWSDIRHLRADCDDFDTDAAFESFFAGVEEDERGTKIWSASLDESK